MKTLNFKMRRAIASFCLRPLLALGIFVFLNAGLSTASAQYTYHSDDVGTNILVGGNGFTGAPGQTLTIGTPGNSTDSYHAVVKGLNSGGAGSGALAEINVVGQSSVTFSGRDVDFDITQESIFNFEDQSKLLLGTGSSKTRGHIFGGSVIINYNSTAASENKNIPFRFHSSSGGEGLPTTLNVNAGSILIGGLDFFGSGVVNLSGGDLVVKVIGGNNRSAGKINFDSSAGSTFTILNANSADYLETTIGMGRIELQVDGVPQTELSAFDINYSVTDGSLTVQSRSSKRAKIPEWSMGPLFTGLFVVFFCAVRRRR